MRKVLVAVLFIMQIIFCIRGQDGVVVNPPGAEIIKEEERRASRGNPIPFFRNHKTEKEKRQLEKIFRDGEKKLLKPSNEEFEVNSLFLKKPKTYLVKIFPDVECSPKVVDANDFKCLQAARMTGKGAYYSFRKNSHIDLSKFDIYFSNAEFSIIKSPNLIGYFQDLGKVSIDSIDENSTQLVTLVKHKIPLTKSEILIEQEKLAQGFRIGEEKVFSKFITKLNSAFALRLVSYEKKVSDLLIIGSLIRENDDGSVTILWKELSNKKAPIIVFEKNEKLTDLKN